jgi:hypothetical protein
MNAKPTALQETIAAISGQLVPEPFGRVPAVPEWAPEAPQTAGATAQVRSLDSIERLRAVVMGV